MVAAEEMGHKGIRAMSPLDSTLANALRVKLGKGRDLPEAPKPKRVPRPRVAEEAGDAATVGDAVAKKPASRSRRTKTEEEVPVDVKPAATIVKPKPAAPIVSRPAVPAAPPAPPVPAPAPVPVAPAAVTPVVVEEPSAPPVEVRRELIRVPESVTVGELAEKMRRKSGEVIKALLELGVMATVNELLDPTAAKLVADDGVMPQTQEAINHARAANVPIIVAVNKIDRPEADPERVKRELSNLNLVPEEWGGQTIFVPTSAKTGAGIDQLLEMTALQSEILELKANSSRAAKGVIIEGRLDRGRGPVATALIQNGSLREGDAVVVGSYSGRVRSLLDPAGKKVKVAGPSDPVEIQGLSGVPAAGDVLVAVSDERKARQIATMRLDREKAKGKTTTRITLEGLQKQIQTGEVKELRLILKGDVQGSVEALAESLERLSTDEVKLKVIHSSVGMITESDVMLASASNAIVLGFNVKAEPKATAQAQANGVDVRNYNVIYEAINDLKAALAGMLAPEIRETALGRAQVRQIFVISKLGPICGSFVAEGKIVRGAKVRVRRGDEVVAQGTVGSLKRFKDDVREVLAGLECGIGVDGVSGIQLGDILEAYTVEEVARTL